MSDTSLVSFDDLPEAREREFRRRGAHHLDQQEAASHSGKYGTAMIGVPSENLEEIRAEREAGRARAAGIAAVQDVLLVGGRLEDLRQKLARCAAEVDRPTLPPPSRWDWWPVRLSVVIVAATMGAMGAVLFSGSASPQPEQAKGVAVQVESPGEVASADATIRPAPEPEPNNDQRSADPLLLPTSGVDQERIAFGADPEPMQTASALAPQTPAVPPISEPAASASPLSATVPTACLPSDLLNVLQDIEARFGPVTLVSTTHLHTDNHSRGSARHKLHAECKAVDFKVKGDVRAVTAYLRSRPEVAGINSFRNNGVIHIDHNEHRKVWRR